MQYIIYYNKVNKQVKENICKLYMKRTNIKSQLMCQINYHFSHVSYILAGWLK